MKTRYVNPFLMGDLRCIRERAARIETLEEQHIPFARRFSKLIQGFEKKDILALVKQYIENQ